MLRSCLSVAMVVASASALWGWSGKCVGVVDGDTIVVLHDGKPEKIRLYGVDAPEAHQAFGQRAKQFTAALAYGRLVEVNSKRRDAFGRTVAEVQVQGGRHLDRLLVYYGMAWWYRRYAPADAVLRRIEYMSWAKRRGLWADNAPVPPWEFRRGAKASETTPAKSYWRGEEKKPAETAPKRSTVDPSWGDVYQPPPATPQVKGGRCRAGGDHVPGPIVKGRRHCANCGQFM